MVFLALSPAGLSEAIQLAHGSPVWCGAEAIGEAAFQALSGANVTRFAYTISGEDAEVLGEAVATIQEHHPNERIWVESAGEL
jgi:hypothetical protein